MRCEMCLFPFLRVSVSGVCGDLWDGKRGSQVSLTDGEVDASADDDGRGDLKDDEDDICGGVRASIAAAAAVLPVLCRAHPWSEEPSICSQRSEDRLRACPVVELLLLC